MGTIRVKRTPGDFFQAYKPTFQNEILSFAARGLLAYLCTKPDNWEVRNFDLVNASPGGKAALQTILTELKTAGHLHRQAKKNKDGTFAGWETTIYENPADNPYFEDPTEIPIIGKTGNRNDRKPERPETGMRKELIISPTNNNLTNNEKEDAAKKSSVPPTAKTKLKSVKKKKSVKTAPPPAVEEYRKVMHRYPNKNVWQDIAEKIGDKTDDLELWKQIVKAYKLLKWNPQNFENMFRYFDNNEIPTTNRERGHTNGGNSTNAQQNKATNEAAKTYLDPRTGKYHDSETGQPLTVS